MSPIAATTASACSRSIPVTGALAPKQWVPTKGSVPRFFAFDPAERFLYIANQGGHSIVACKVGRDGKLSPTSFRLRVGSPACIVFSRGVSHERQRATFRDLSVHAGAAPDPATGARALPIYQTTAYVFEDADHAAALFNLQTVGFIYSRLTTRPTPRSRRGWPRSKAAAAARWRPRVMRRRCWRCFR